MRLKDEFTTDNILLLMHIGLKHLNIQTNGNTNINNIFKDVFFQSICHLGVTSQRTKS